MLSQPVLIYQIFPFILTSIFIYIYIYHISTMEQHIFFSSFTGCSYNSRENAEQCRYNSFFYSLRRYDAITRANMMNLNMIKSSSTSVWIEHRESWSHSFGLVHLNRLRVELDLECESLAIFEAKVMWCKIGSEFMQRVRTCPERWRMEMRTD